MSPAVTLAALGSALMHATWSAIAYRFTDQAAGFVLLMALLEGPLPSTDDPDRRDHGRPEPGACPVELAAELLALIVAEFPARRVHGVGDAAYHGQALLVDGSTWTTRLPANAALFAPAPPRTGRRGRPALKGARLGRPEVIAQTVTWRRVTVQRYGWAETVHVACVDCV